MECTHDILSSFQVVESAKRTEGLPVPYVDVVPKTRDRIIEHMTNFLESPSMRGYIPLYGFAGCGKSTLLERVAEEIEDDRIHIFTASTVSIIDGEVYIIRDYGADAKIRDLRPMFEKIQRVLVVMGVNYGEEDDAKRKMSEIDLQILDEFSYGKEVATRLLDIEQFADLVRAHKFAYKCDRCGNECRFRDFYRLAFEYIDQAIEGEENVLDRLYFLYLYSFATRRDITDRLTPRYVIRWMVESAAFREKVHLVPSVDAAWSGRTTEDDFLNPSEKFNSLFVGGLAFKAFVTYLKTGVKGPVGAEFENLFLNGIKQYVLVKFEQTSRIEKETIPNELLIGAFSDRMTTYDKRKYPVFYLEKRHLSFGVDPELMEIRVGYKFDAQDVILRLPYEIFRSLYELAQGTIVLSEEKSEEFLRKFLDDCLYHYAKRQGFENAQHLLISAANSSPALSELMMSTERYAKTRSLVGSGQSVVLYIGKSLGSEYEPVNVDIIEFRGTHVSRGTRGGRIPRKSIQPEASRLRAFVASAYAYLKHKVDLPESMVDWVTEQMVEEGVTGIIIPTREEVDKAELSPEELAVLIGFQRMFSIHKGTDHCRHLEVPGSISDLTWFEDLEHITPATREFYLYYLTDIGFLNKRNRFEEIRLSPLFLAATVKFESCRSIEGKLLFSDYKKMIQNHFCVHVVDDGDLKKRLAWLGMYEKSPDGAEIVKQEGD